MFYPALSCLLVFLFPWPLVLLFCLVPLLLYAVLCDSITCWPCPVLSYAVLFCRVLFVYVHVSVSVSVFLSGCHLSVVYSICLRHTFKTNNHSEGRRSKIPARLRWISLGIANALSTLTSIVVENWTHCSTTQISFVRSRSWINWNLRQNSNITPKLVQNESKL